MINKIVAAQLMASAACNLNCSYCSIPKTKGLKKINEQIIQMIKDGSYIKSIANAFGEDQIETLSLWGGEPTLTFDLFTKEVWKNCLNILPNLKSIAFSTNLIIDPIVILNFFNNAPKSRPIDFNLQFSLDGVPEINDKNRGKGTTAIIVTNLEKLIKGLLELDLTPHKLSIHNKVTWNSNNLKYFSDDCSRIDEHISFIDKINDMGLILKNNKNVRWDITYWANCETPGNYTTQDGKNYAIVFRRLKELYDDSKKNLGKMNFNTHGLDRIFNYGFEYYSKHKMFPCSAGDSMFCINWDGIMTPCHRGAYLGNDEILEKDGDYAEMFKDRYMVSSTNTSEVDRIRYILSAYQNFSRLKLNNSIAIIKELVEVGQISEIYKDYNKAYLLAAYMGLYHCSQDAVINQASLFAPSISTIRLYGNGALEILIDSLRGKE